jgi:protein-S-isoprenylcysteine O-methyltransferase Ste14
MFLAGFILAGLDYRYKWLQVPQWLNYTGIVLFILSYALYAEVLRENAYLSRTISVATGQKLIDKGLYGIVRHPMYTATIFLFISMPLVLGSFISFFIFLIYPFLIAYRAVNEEKFLVKELEGYDKYLLKVKYRFIPFIW